MRELIASNPDETLTFRWLETGDGEAVVLIHGIPTSPELWRRVLPLLPGCRVLAWEMVGYGRSWRHGLGNDIAVSAQADHLFRWLDQLGIERAVLVGHDLGGGVAQIAAVNRPERVRGVLLCNSIGYDSWPIPSVRAMGKAGGLLERMPPSMFRRLFSSVIRQGHDNRRRARESIAAHWPGYAHPDGAAAFVRQIRSLRTEDTLEIADRLPRLNAPAGVVWGVADRFQKAKYGRRLARDLRAELTEIPGGQHFVPEDHPEELASAIRSIVDRRGRTRQRALEVAVHPADF
jgi:pimeloyl-ACP methyl ester carboxylesterase